MATMEEIVWQVPFGNTLVPWNSFEYKGNFRYPFEQRVYRYHFVGKNEHKCELRRLLDKYFDRTSNHFDNPENLYTITACDKYPWHFGHMQLSHGINDHICSLIILTDGNNASVSIIKKPNHEPPSKQQHFFLTLLENKRNQNLWWRLASR